jgi:exonuclease VII large subunit
MGRRVEIPMLGLMLVLFLLGCDRGAPEPTDANQATAAKLKQDAEKTLQTAKDLAAQERDKLLEASRQRLIALERQFNRWVDDVASEDQQAQATLAQLSGAFRNALTRAREILAEAGEVGVDAWEEAKPDLETAVDAAQNAYDAFMAHVQSQIKRQEQTEADPGIIE